MNLTVLAAAALAPASTEAADWRVAASSPFVIYYVDIQSMRFADRDDPAIIVFKLDSRLTVTNVRSDKILTHFAARCTDGAYQELGMEVWKNGKLVRRDNEVKDPMPRDGHSLGQAIEAVCTGSWGRKPIVNVDEHAAAWKAKRELPVK